jgi:hypothetical protein
MKKIELILILILISKRKFGLLEKGLGTKFKKTYTDLHPKASNVCYKEN